MNEGHTGFVRITGGTRRVGHAVEQHFSRIRREIAAQDVHQRRLSSTVFSHHSQRLAVIDLEGDLFEYGNTKEGLVDSS